MSIIVTDTGFGADDWHGGIVPLAERPANDNALAVDLGPETDPALLPELLTAPLIRIAFPSFADGRGFTLAALLRRAGYAGRLRAKGHVLADQYAMARRAGFDEVEISETLAARQTEDQWLARADWRARDYQARLRG